MNFERGLDPKESMGIGVDALLKQLGVKFAHTQLGDPIFVKEEEPDTTVSIRPLIWDSKQLRAIADYMDAHPESTKVIEIIDDHSPRRVSPPMGINPTMVLEDLDAPMGVPWTAQLKKR